MPFKSESQRRFLFAKHPTIAKRWAREETKMAQSDRDKKVAAFVGKGKPPRFPSPHGQATTRPGKLSGGNRPTEDYPFAKGRPGKKITEDDPRWIAGLMGNKKWGKKWRGPENYGKGKGRPD